MKKVDFENKPLGFNKKVKYNKTKLVFVENELNELSEKVKLLSAKD